MTEWVLRGGTVIEPTGATPEPRRVDLAIENGRISRWSEPVDRVPGESWDASGLWVIPGLIDLRLILWRFDAGAGRPVLPIQLARFAFAAQKELECNLGAGVTTALTSAAWDNVDLELRDWVNSGRLRGPRLYASGTAIGPLVDGTLRQAGALLEVSGPDEARRAARQQVKAGADALVIQVEWRGTTGQLPSRLDVDEIRAVMDEAGHAGVWCCGVAETPEAQEVCIRAGVDIAPCAGPLAAVGELRPYEALRELTSVAAQKLGCSADAGSLLPGRRADLLVLEADPLASTENLRRVRAVFQSGRLVTPNAA